MCPTVQQYSFWRRFYFYDWNRVLMRSSLASKKIKVNDEWVVHSLPDWTRCNCGYSLYVKIERWHYEVNCAGYNAWLFFVFLCGHNIGVRVMHAEVCSACQGLSKGSWYALAMLADFVKSKGQYENTSLNRKGKKNRYTWFSVGQRWENF